MYTWQLVSNVGDDGALLGALTSEEREQIIASARMERAIIGDQGTRFYEDPYELKTGDRKDAARGLDDRMRADQAVFHSRIPMGAEGIEEEALEFASGTPEYCAGLREIVDYVMKQRTSEKLYPNGMRDQGRNGVKPQYFITHAMAQEARLSEEEVYALRIYTTFAFRDMNIPLRDDARYARNASVPLPVTSHLAAKAIRKLRAVRAKSEEKDVVLWRGMRSLRVTEAFMRDGGTELAFMSTTTDLSVAVRYSLSRNSLLFKIVPQNFMSNGAELQWLSAFPGEAEVLFPPLTFLQPTGRRDSVNAVDQDGRPMTFTVIEVIPSFGS